jgi:hypothetical protein
LRSKTKDFTMKIPASEKLSKIIIAASTAILVAFAFFFKGASDDGDSLNHYFYARFAFQHPENFFHHWAKPLFVTLAAPFAQLGLVGVKIFNVACIALAAVLTFRIAEKLNIKNAWLGTLIYFSLPMTSFLTLSGLTEPLFALWCIAGIYLMVFNRPVASVLMLSFLPFVRSEGLIIICIFILYLLIKKQWKYLPLLLVGHIIYGIAGAPFHNNDFLWTINANPYARTDGFYGAGDWFHFIRHLPPLTGKIAFILLGVGLLYGLIRLIGFWRNKNDFSKAELWLIYGSFMAFFVGHTTFWALGIFHSFGLLRVLLGVLPVMSLIMLQGANILIEASKKVTYKNTNKIVIFFAVVISLGGILSNGRSFFAVTGEQIAVAKMMEQHGAAWKKDPHRVYYYDAPAVTEGLGIDCFDKKIHRSTGDTRNEPIPNGAIIIWDDGLSKLEQNTMPEDFLTLPGVKKIGIFKGEYRLLRRLNWVEVFQKDSIIATPNTIIFEENFENIAENVSEKMAFEGKKVGFINEGKAFSPTFKSFLKNYTDGKKTLKLRFSGMVMTEDKGKADWQSPSIVTSVESKKENAFYHAKPAIDATMENGKWHAFDVTETFSPQILDNEKLVFYLWNPTKYNLFMDNLKVTVVE